MKKIPVYGFEKFYEVSENGVIYSLKTGEVKFPAKNASSKQPRYRLNDKKYYDGKYLVIKSFYPTLNLENKLILFKSTNHYDISLSNLEVLPLTIESKARNLSFIYEEDIKPLLENSNYFISENGNLYTYYTVPRLIKPFLRQDGYYQVTLTEESSNLRIRLKIHRLVAKYFVSNQNNLLIVNHIDGDKLNNTKQNLEWCDSSHNNREARRLGLHPEPMKKCCMVDRDNCILEVFESIADLSREYGVDNSTASKQCRGIKNKFITGNKARLYDEENKTFVKTKFD